MTVERVIVQGVARALRQYVRYAPGQRGKAAMVQRILDPYLEQNPVTTLVSTTFGAQMPVTTSDLIQRYLYLFGVWEPNLTAWLHHRLRPGDTFVDVGANVGYFSLLAARLVGPTGNVVAIEACPSLYGVLTRTLEANGCRNTRAVHLAVSDGTRAGLCFYLEDPNNLGATTQLPPSHDSTAAFTVDALPLPDILTTAELAAARVIKIDVEGAEGAVVRGLISHLDRLRPDVELVIEVHPRRMASLGDDVEELFAQLRAHGFQMYRLDNDYAASSYPAALHAPMPPVRWRNRIDDMVDLVFSRADVSDLG